MRSGATKGSLWGINVVVLTQGRHTDVEEHVNNKNSKLEEKRLP